MTEPILDVSCLRKHFRQRHGWLGRTDDAGVIPAVEDVSFVLHANETLGLVGESGCGKTTTGKMILRLLPVTAGTIRYRGHDITHLSQAAFRPLRREIQMIFQDLDAALNPRMRIEAVLREAIRLREPELDDAGTQQRLFELIDLVSLKKSKLSSFASELSGGEKRRVGIARALAVRPQLIVADEPTSALDVSIQAQVINLLRDLQARLGLAYLFISHDLQLVELVSHRVAVMYLGRIVEIGPAAQIAGAPQHPYTAVLWSSLVEKRSREVATERAVMWGVFDFERPGSGCPFASRCPRYAELGRPAVCVDAAHVPALTAVGADRAVACHFPLG
jgi:oligopeptide/dipeptide ABC transporter ATP-binding protein